MGSSKQSRRGLRTPAPLVWVGLLLVGYLVFSSTGQTDTQGDSLTNFMDQIVTWFSKFSEDPNFFLYVLAAAAIALFVYQKQQGHQQADQLEAVQTWIENAGPLVWVGLLLVGYLVFSSTDQTGTWFS